MNEEKRIDGSAEAVKELIAIGRASAGPQTFKRKQDDVDGVCHYVLVPEGYTPQLLKDKPPEAPDRIRCTVNVVDIKSFMRYVNEHKNDHSRIFASVLREPFGLNCALDYHGDRLNPSFIEHRCALSFTPTDNWRTWDGNDRKAMTQEAFALFIEENQPDIVAPSGADMLELAINMEATKGATFKKKIRLDNGDTDLIFEENTQAQCGGGTIHIPQEITLSMPIFLGMGEVPVQARFRYRLEGGGIKFSYEIVRKQALLLKTIQAALDIVEEETEVPYFLGCFVSEA